MLIESSSSPFHLTLQLETKILRYLAVSQQMIVDFTSPSLTQYNFDFCSSKRLGPEN